MVVTPLLQATIFFAVKLRSILFHEKIITLCTIIRLV